MVLNSSLVPRLQSVADRFWHFSKQVYSAPEVKKLCLCLQDKHHRNVNLLLWLSFCQQQSWTVNLELLLTHIRCSEHKLTAFRLHRRAMKPHLSDTQYQLLLKHELKLERRQQHLLVLSQQRHPGGQSAEAALKDYLEQIDAASQYLNSISMASQQSA
ncbi:TIGR02444 family protein [Agarivorans sp. MS3-6]|uniref:TIGR02444 family protein n=1 Tax=Agarivorans sp. TSD2052 TaxID=2937286 RepID=UPI00200BCF64|nr:TIGR02444 family protein [Agarivorans sp. TSD2052]UPW19605.1 TIGR02444 family protein [Agarivorans sp. TSD2052]